MNPINSIPSITNAYGTIVDRAQGPGAASTTAVQGTGPVAAADNFTQSLTNAIASVSGLQTNADQAVAGLAQNNGVDIHEAMIAMEQASLGMHLAVQVRDKAVEAYQTLMNMQM